MCDLPTAFQQQQQKCPPKFRNFQPQFNLFFNEKIINIQELCTASLNTMKPSPCTPPHRELSKKDQEPQSEASWFGGSHKYKTNKLPSFISKRSKVMGWPQVSEDGIQFIMFEIGGRFLGFLAPPLKSH